jgi:tetratricopeptide (TPR) repeat protein
MAALIYELFNYVSEYSVRRVLKVTIKGSELIDKGYADEALKLYEKILGKISKSEKPLLYAQIRQNRAKSYYALSKRQDRKLYLEKAMNELEDILDIKELGEHLASIKASLADLYYDYYMEDDSIAYLNKALELYEWSMKCFSRDQNIEDYMDVLNKVNKAKEKLMLATIS